MIIKNRIASFLLSVSRCALLLSLCTTANANEGIVNYTFQPEQTVRTQNAKLVESRDARRAQRLTAAETSDSVIANKTLAGLERSALTFDIGLDGKAEVAVPLNHADAFDRAAFWVKAEDAPRGAIWLQLKDAKGNAYRTKVAPVPQTWTLIDRRLEFFDPVDTSPAGRTQNFTQPLTELSVVFEPEKADPEKRAQLSLGGVSFINDTVDDLVTYPYGPGFTPMLLKRDREFPDYSRFLPEELEQTYFIAVVYEGGDDSPHQYYDRTDKFQVLNRDGSQHAFKDGTRLSLVKEGTGVFNGRFRFGTIETDKVRLWGDDILQIEYAAEGISVAPGTISMMLNFTDGSSATITDEVEIIADGQAHVITYRLPAEAKGKQLSNLRIRFFNPTEGWAQLDLIAMALLHPNLNTRIDADAILAREPEHDVRVQVVDGMPVITIDGERLSGMGFADQRSANASDDDWDAMLNRTNITNPIARVVIPLTEDIYLHASPSIWKGPDLFDYAYLDQQIERVLKVSPEAKIMIYAQVDGAKWWNYRNRDAVGIDAMRGVPDYLSEEWTRDLRDAVRQFIAHVQSQPYAASVIGYQIWGGSSLDTNVEINDATPAAIERFRAFLRQKYGSDAALQIAWGDASVTLDTAMPEMMISDSHPYDRSDPFSLLINPENRRAYLDSYDFRSYVAQQNLINISEFIKEATHGRALTGSRVGNFIGGQWLTLKHGFRDTNYEPSIDLLMQSPAFDILELQEPYPGRSLGYDGGIGTPNAPPAGTAKHNKLIMVQNDYPWGYNLGASMDERGKHTRRVYGHAIMSGLYPYEWRVGKHRYTFDFPELMEEYRAIAPVFDKAVWADRNSVAEVAVVCDVDYKKYLGFDPIFTNPPRAVSLFDVARYTWSRAGMPFDMLFLDQLADARPYKLYVFFHTLELTAEKKALVENLVREKGAVAIFIWADFLMGNHGMDIEGMSETIGMDIAFTEEARHWKLRPEQWFRHEMNPSALYPLGDIDRFQHQGWQPGQPRPIDNFYAPSFKVVDRSAKPIATYEGTNDVAIAVKSVGRGTSIYSAPATLSPSLLRYAGKLAGCFQYSDTEDALFVNESFVFIHAGRSGNINLSLPKADALYEVFSGKEYPDATDFTIPVKKDETYLFFRGTAKEWEELGGRK